MALAAIPHRNPEIRYSVREGCDHGLMFTDELRPRG